MRILLSNDDGVHAPGLLALHRELKKLGKVLVVAPLEERSTTGHSLTIHKPLRMIDLGKGFYGVSGSPADCIYLGMRKAMKGMPDLVISGINRGANLGQDTYYSGTVAAAREACIFGVPSIAVSTTLDVFDQTLRDDEVRFDTAAKMTVRLIKQLMSAPGGLRLPRHTFLNLNVPNMPLSKVRGFRLTRQGFRYYTGGILHRKDHRGKSYYWVGGRYRGFCKTDGDSDCLAVDRGYASVTPLKLDSTDLQFLAEFESVMSESKPRRRK